MDIIAAARALLALSQPTRLETIRLLVRSGSDGMPAGKIARAQAIPHNTLFTGPTKRTVKKAIGYTDANRSRTNALLKSSRWVAFLLLAAAIPASACEQNRSVDPDAIRELLGTAGEVTRSHWQECPYLAMRVKPEPLESGEQSGWVLIVFDVSKIGRPINKEIVNSSLGEEYQRKALELADAFRFRPVVRNSQVHVFENWFERVDFLPENAAPDPLWPDPKKLMNPNCSS